MAGEDKPIDIGVFNQLNLPQLTSAEEDRIISRIPLINWSAIPFCSLEILVKEGNACTVRITKTCKIASDGTIS